MEYICLYLRLIFPKMSNTQQHNNEEATCGFFPLLLSKGLFFKIFLNLHVLVQISPLTETLHLSAEPDACMMCCSFIINDGRN